MPSLNELIIAQTQDTVREDLLDRLAIVEHKIKFIEKIPLCILDADGQPSLALGDLANLAGAVLTTVPAEAVYVIFREEGSAVEGLMALAPDLLNADWPAVKYSRICLLADAYDLNSAEDAIALVESIAEMTHPGHFIFGDEGARWIRFSV